MPSQALNAISFKGDLLVRDRGVTGAKFIAIGDLQKLEFGMETETKEAKSKGLYTFGQTISSVTNITATSLTLAFNALSKSGYALAFAGVAGAWSQASGTEVTKALTVKLDQWIPLDHRRVSSPAIPTFTLGTHYVVDLEQGLVMFHSGVSGGAVADASHTITYSHAAITGGEKMSLFREASMSVEIRGNLQDQVTGEYVELVIPRADLSPASGFDLMADDFPEVEMTAKLIQDTSHWAYDVNNPSTAYLIRRPKA